MRRNNYGRIVNITSHLGSISTMADTNVSYRISKAGLNALTRILATELEGYARSARAAHAEATDEQSKAENKYDTRGLEASYLAHGQSRQAAETAEALEQFAALAHQYQHGAIAQSAAAVLLAI